MVKPKIWLFSAIFSAYITSALQARASWRLEGYVPADNPQKVEQRRSVGSGSRSNCHSSIERNSVTLLVPESEVVHRTTWDRPTLFVSAERSSKIPFKFTLVDPQTAETLVERDFVVSEPVEAIELPQSTQLELGKVYLWYVAIPCENNPDEYREVLGAALERVKPSQSLAARLRQTNEPAQAASIYASNGFWYEALEIALNNSEHSDYLERLLGSANLPLVEPKKIQPTSLK